jgi:integrase
MGLVSSIVSHLPADFKDFEREFAERLPLHVLVLLDTGIRASELCALKIADVDLKTGEMNVQGKGKKERCCYPRDVARRSL